jgi:hypothetical protein
MQHKTSSKTIFTGLYDNRKAAVNGSNQMTTTCSSSIPTKCNDRRARERYDQMSLTEDRVAPDDNEMITKDFSESQTHPHI